MKRLQRQILLTSGDSVSSLWQIPDSYRANSGSALIIAHGAGNDMHSEFIQQLTAGFADKGMMTVCFNFPYKEKGNRPPDRAPVLEACWQDVVSCVTGDPALAPGRLFLSGKSMGGRMATHIAAAGTACDGVVLFGYPLHPPGKPEKLRADHLAAIPAPTLFLQGTRDSLCQLDKLGPLLKQLPKARLHVIEGGDHSFKVLKRLGRSQDEVMQELVDTTISWMDSV